MPPLPAPLSSPPLPRLRPPLLAFLRCSRVVKTPFVTLLVLGPATLVSSHVRHGHCRSSSHLPLVSFGKPRFSPASPQNIWITSSPPQCAPRFLKKDFYLFIFRERGKEGERNQLVASCTSPTRDPALNPGMCPNWESNQQPFGSQANAQSTEPHQPGCIAFCCSHLFVGLSSHWTGGWLNGRGLALPLSELPSA